MAPNLLRVAMRRGSSPKMRALPAVGRWRPGYTVVVPRLEVDHWIDVDPQILSHLTEIAQVIGRAQMVAFNPVRVGVMIAGLEVPHLHIHVVPIRGMHDLDFGNQDPNPDPKVMDDAARALRDGVRKLGFGDSVPA